MKSSRRQLDFSGQLAQKGWYHSFKFLDGSVVEGVLTLEQLERRYGSFPLPPDLSNKRVLDIGAWDGWFSFEAEWRGALATAIDCVEIPNFLRAHQALSSQVEYRILDVFDLPKENFEPFDYVFFLGVLYHLKHPLLALEIVCSLTKEIAIVDSFVTNGSNWQEAADEIPSLEFYETDELGGHLDNWFGPTVGCLRALCRAAGFARTEVLETQATLASVACYRRFEPPPTNPSHEPPHLAGVRHTRNGGVNFYTNRDEYLSWWLTGVPEGTAKEGLLLEIDVYGVPAMSLRQIGEGMWQANSRLPPGLDRGWKQVRARLSDSSFSNSRRIAVDLPARAESIAFRGICDSSTWEQDRITRSEQGALASCWISGLTENCDLNNIQISIGGTRVQNLFVGEADSDGVRQVNVRLPASMASGSHEAVVRFGGVTSPTWTVIVK